MSNVYRRIMACMALLIWLMSASAGVHAHFGHDAHPDHDSGHHHESVLSVHSLLDASHEEQHADGAQIDTGLEQLQSAVGKPGSKFDLLLLPLIPQHIAAGFASVLTHLPVVSPPLKPPRQGSSSPPPLRAPPFTPV